MIKGLEDTHSCSKSPRQLRSPFNLVFISFFPKHSTRWWRLIPICTRLLPSYGKWLYRPTGSWIVYPWAKQVRFKDEWYTGIDSLPRQRLLEGISYAAHHNIGKQMETALCFMAIAPAWWPAPDPAASHVPNSLCWLCKICYNWGYIYFFNLPLQYTRLS